MAGAIEYLQEHGVKNIEIIEGSWVGARTEEACRSAGYEAVCKTYGVPFYDLKQYSATQVQPPFGPIAICDRARTADFLINLPVLKKHCQTVMTCALKNCKGVYPGPGKTAVSRRWTDEANCRSGLGAAASSDQGVWPSAAIQTLCLLHIEGNIHET